MTPTPVTPPTARRRTARSVTVRNVSWDAYEKLVEAFGETPRVRLTYDRGVLDIMVPSLDHDYSDRTLAQLVLILAEEFGVPFRPGGQTTMKKQKRLKGIEADDIFWLANAGALAGAKELDLTIHPPPDLAIEVDVTRDSRRRLRVYAALGVPEIWLLRGIGLTFLGLIGQRYVALDRSRSFPAVAPADLLPVLDEARSAGDQRPVYLAFRAWARERAKADPAAGGEPAAG